MIILGDCLEHLRELPENSVDAVVTDPPYGLSFMGKKWDYDVPSVDIWREVLRVLKPGGHLLSFGGTRTYHRMVVNIEDAGFEIRDQIQWIYGSGFPKSHDVSKAIDKMHGAEREVVGRYTRPDGTNVSLSGSKYPQSIDRTQPDKDEKLNLTTPATPDAKKWQGWGTALKPANEPIVLARKPLIGTVAQNVLEHGTGGLNIDATRIAVSDDDPNHRKSTGGYIRQESEATIPNAPYNKQRDATLTQGRWPANVIFDEESAALLDEMSGVSDARGGKPKDKSEIAGNINISATGGPKVVRNDSGGASRFFYVAKASKRERNAGLEGMPENLCEIEGAILNSDESDNPNTRGRKANPIDCITQNKSKLKNGNFHPTVKPLKLMQYLIKLITPPGGIVLDPFAGSGSTGVTAKSLGFEFIGIEMNAEYVAIAEKRIEAAL